MMKQVLALSAFFLSAVCFGQVPDYVPTEGLVGWFPCDSSLLDLTGTYTADEVAFDGFVEGAYGNVNGALEFDGESDFVRFNGNPGFEDFSIGLWVKTEFEEHGPIVHVGRDDGTEYNGFSLGIGGESMNTPGNYLKAHFSGVGYFDVSSSVPYESWQHVCVTWGSQVMTFYVQGELVGTVSTASTFFTPSSKLYFAAFSETIYEKYGGAIDQIGLWNRVLSPAEVSQLFAWNTPVGCTEQLACNFDPDAALDDGSCHFNCQFCDDGTVWDEDVFKCVVANPSDTDLDGCVGMTDLLDLLSVFGTCAEEEPEEDPEVAEWSCGDPVGYHGYDYQTVLIGEQCWFAENLRATHYQNGDELGSSLEGDSWGETESGAYSIYGEGNGPCDAANPDFNACDASAAEEGYGLLYNGHAAMDERNLCPNHWHVGSDVDWLALKEQLSEEGFSGQEGGALKSSSGWKDDGGGTDVFGFHAVSGGSRNFAAGSFNYAGEFGRYWTSTMSDDGNGWRRSFAYNNSLLERYDGSLNTGSAVRCIKNAE